MPARLILIAILVFQPAALLAVTGAASRDACAATNCCVTVTTVSCCGEVETSSECSMSGGTCLCAAQPGEPLPAAPPTRELAAAGLFLAATSTAEIVWAAPRRAPAVHSLTAGRRVSSDTHALLCIWRT